MLRSALIAAALLSTGPAHALNAGDIVVTTIPMTAVGMDHALRDAGMRGPAAFLSAMPAVASFQGIAEWRDAGGSPSEGGRKAQYQGFGKGLRDGAAAVPVSAAPEPSFEAMLLAGACMLGLIVRRRMR